LPLQICLSLHTLPSKIAAARAGSAEQERLKQQLADAQEHARVAAIQREATKKAIADPPSDTLVLLMDFGCIDLTKPVGEGGVTDSFHNLLNIVAHFRESANGPVIRRYFDFICQDKETANNDYFFLRKGSMPVALRCVVLVTYD
jgi:hypothetical protein